LEVWKSLEIVSICKGKIQTSKLALQQKTKLPNVGISKLPNFLKFGDVLVLGSPCFEDVGTLLLTMGFRGVAGLSCGPSLSEPALPIHIQYNSLPIHYEMLWKNVSSDSTRIIIGFYKEFSTTCYGGGGPDSIIIIIESHANLNTT
jgi:hypothetical protein